MKIIENRTFVAGDVIHITGPTLFLRCRFVGTVFVRGLGA